MLVDGITNIYLNKLTENIVLKKFYKLKLMQTNEENDCLLKNSKEKIYQLQKVQEALYNIDADKISSVFHLIIDNQFINDKSDLLTLIRFILYGCKIRPMQIAIYAHLCTLLHMSSQSSQSNQFSLFKEIIKKYLFSNIDSYCEILFLYELMNDEFISLQEIISTLTRIYDENPLMPILIHAFLFFGPEIHQNSRKLYESLLNDINSSVADSIIVRQVNFIKQHIWQNRGRESLFQYYRLNGRNSEIFNAVAVDNSDFFIPKYHKIELMRASAISTEYFQRFEFLNNSPTYLIVSAYFDSTKCFHHMLSKGVLINQLDSGGNNSFIASAAGGAKNIFSYLLNKEKKYSQAATFAAIQYHQYEIQNIIFETFRKEINTFQILQHSLKYMNLNCFLSSIDSPSPFKIVNEKGQNILMLASKFGFPDLVNYIIQYYENNIYLRDLKRRSVLHYAIKSKNLQIVQLILSLFKKDNPFLIENEFRDFSQFNFDTMKPNSFINNVICTASEIGTVEIVDYLLNFSKSNINLKNQDSLSLLHYACKGSNIDVVKYLLSKDNLLINNCDYTEQSALYIAIAKNSYEIVKLILDDPRTNIIAMKDIYLFYFIYFVNNDSVTLCRFVWF